MRLISTRGKSKSVSIDDAIMQGLADDGGLFVPEQFPQLPMDELKGISDYADFAAHFLSPFFIGSAIQAQLPSLCQHAFNFPLPVNKVNSNTYLLELFHGPTLSFKDFGARFLAACLDVLSSKEQPMTVLTATSGDTGSAVASSLHGRPGVEVMVLYPKGKISLRQRAQIASLGGNVHAMAVEGDFDDCQRLVKAAFADPWCRETFHLTTANSINIARILAQVSYYAFIAIHNQIEHKSDINIIVPSGNLGNVTACVWAKKMGAPIGKIAIATNANQVVSDYVKQGEYQPQATIETLANAMDVGAPSNFERLAHLFDDAKAFNASIEVMSVSDEKISSTIQYYYQHYQQVICPHTATAAYMRRQHSHEPWLIVATAAPVKFEQIIEPLLSIELELPRSLQEALARPLEFKTIKPNVNGFLETMKALKS